jgi:hypothetical protein
VLNVLGIDNQRKGGNVLPCLQAAIDGATDQQPADAASMLIRATGKTPHAEAGHGVAGQALAVGGCKPLAIHLGGTERVAAEDVSRPRRVGEDKGRV